jgi:phosphoglycolate phosphatase
MSRPLSPSAIAFDLDGTLVDSRRDIATAVNRLRSDLGLPELRVEAVSSMVGEGARKLVERALAVDFPEASPERIDEALAIYLRHYDEVCLDTTRLYPGVAEMLRALAGRYPLGVLSNKGESFSRRILEGLGVDGSFRAVVGGDTLPSRKPNPAGLTLLAERLGVSPEDLLLVGDTWIDAETAGNAGCPFALVEWGFLLPTAPDAARVNLRVATAEELAAALA